jgi:CHAT domain-containing protein/Tfp pilus assembly protein PilF
MSDEPRQPTPTTPSSRRRWIASIGGGLLVVIAAGIWSLRCAPETESHGAPDETEDRGETVSDVTEEIGVLEPGRRTEHALADRAVHAYRLPLARDQYVAVAVEQRGLDVVVRLFAPSGELVTEVDSPTGATGTERLTEVAGTEGEYRLEVEAFAGGSESGTYEIGIETLRPATDEDRTGVAAERAFARGEALRRGGRPADALPEYQRALEAWRSLGKRAGEAEAVYRMGWMHHELEERQRAVEFYREALALYREVGDRQQEAVVSNRVGRALLLLGHLVEAGQSHRRALDLFVELREPDGEAAAANNLGNVYKWAGRTEEALAAYERALELWKDLDEPLRQVTALINIGDVYLARNDVDAARLSFERALAGARTESDRESEAVCLLKLGETLERSGRLDEGRRRLEEALAVQRDRDDRRGQAIALNALGTVFLKAGELERAKRSFDEALGMFREVDDPQGQAMAHHKLGRYHYAAGEPERAREHHEAAVPLFRRSGDRQGVASAGYGVARACYALGDYDRALATIEDVLAAAEGLRTESESHQLRASYLASRRHYSDLHVASLMRIHEQEPESGLDLLALQATERWRARGLLDLLVEAGVQVREGAPADLLARERRIGTELDGIERQRLELAREPGNDRVLQDLAERETALLVELDRSRSEIRRKSLRYQELTEHDPLRLSQIQQDVLDPDTLLLVYFLGDERSFLWRVSREGVESHVLAPRGEIEQAAESFYEALPLRSSRAETLRAEAGGRLSEMLLGPVAGSLDGRRLVVVADGGLHYLPFATLPLPGAAPGGSAYEILLDHQEVVHLPSVSVVPVLRRLQAERKRAPKTVAVIADPVFAEDDPRLARSGAPAAGRDVALREAARSLGPGGLRRLSHSAEEARAILTLAPEGSSFAALGFDASPALVRGGMLEDYRILHFATHGLVHRRRAELSGLVLSLYDAQGVAQSGFLRLHEVYDLHLRAELVVLSACETGLGQEMEGEGLVGLTRGFMYAGAPRVIHSLWKVGDESAAELMARFYRQLLEEHLPPSAALRAAQLSMRREERWRDPFHWGAFVFQGDWAPPARPLDDDIEGTDTGGTDPGGGIRSDDDLPPPEPPPSGPVQGYTPPPPPLVGSGEPGGDA